MSKCVILVIFVDLAYSEHEEKEMLAVFTYADEFGLNQALTHLRERANLPSSHTN